MKKKNVTLSIAGTGEPQVKELELAKGTTKKDVLKAGKVSTRFNLVRKTNGDPIGDGQDLYKLLDDNEVLIATPPSGIGTGRGILSRLNSFFEPKARVIEDSEERVSASGEFTHTEPLARDMSSIQVYSTIEVMPSEARGPEAELEDMGWERKGNSFHGHIMDIDGIVYPAELSQAFSGHKLFVRDLPTHVLVGRHSSCFRPVGDGWYWVHFNYGNEYAPGMIRSLQKMFMSQAG